MALTKDGAVALAQCTANRDKKSMAVLNLNQYSPLYVVREHDSRYEGKRDFVCRVDPQEECGE